MPGTSETSRLAACGWQRVPAAEQAAIDARNRASGAWPDERDMPRVWIHERLELHALISRDLLPGETVPRWHISVSAPGGVPAWDQMVRAAHDLRPGVVFVLAVVPKSWWINVHPNVLHLTELRDTALIDQWRAEGRGDTPS